MMERMGAPLDLAPAIGWHNVRDFARHAAANQASNLWRAAHPDEAAYASGLHLNAALADLFDLVAEFATAYATANSKGRRAKRPPRYPRPWVRDSGTKRIGRGAIPVAEFDAWYYGGE